MKFFTLLLIAVFAVLSVCVMAPRAEATGLGLRQRVVQRVVVPRRQVVRQRVVAAPQAIHVAPIVRQRVVIEQAPVVVPQLQLGVGACGISGGCSGVLGFGY